VANGSVAQHTVGLRLKRREVVYVCGAQGLKGTAAEDGEGMRCDISKRLLGGVKPSREMEQEMVRGVFSS